jgi:hypothetical protein
MFNELYKKVIRGQFHKFTFLDHQSSLYRNK